MLPLRSELAMTFTGCSLMCVKPDVPRDACREGTPILFVAGNILIARASASDFRAASGTPDRLT